MRYQFSSPGSSEYFGWRRTPSTIIRNLIIINAGVWLLLWFTTTESWFFPYLGLVPKYFWSRFMIWQPITYMFLHAGFWHVALNMFVLWMFGSELERAWGRRAFLRYYLITGAGAGLVTVLFSLNSSIPVVGASGAIYGVLLAYGLAYPNRYVYLYFMFPVKVKYFVVFLAAMAFFASFQGTASTVSHLTHLSGMAIGWVYLKTGRHGTWRRIGRRLSDLQEEDGTRQEQQKNQEEEELRQRVDRILDKISDEGYTNLTEEEQDILYRASVRFSRREDKD